MTNELRVALRGAVYGELQRQIIAGQLRSRERLVEDEIIERAGATRHAVRRAFDELERVGLVLRKHRLDLGAVGGGTREAEWGAIAGVP